MKLLKRKFILKVIDDLKIYNGTEFEYFCKIILELILKDNVEQKGHNLFAKPVHSTVDFNDDEYKIVGQVGTDKQYFNNLKKPIHDIDRAIELSPECEDIYIFSNKRATGGQRKDLDNEIKKSKKLSTYNIHIYDAENIANLLHNNIHLQKAEELIEKLPFAYEIYKILPQVNSIPKFKNQYFPRSEEKEIIDKLKSKNVVQLYGLSGIGKSEIMKKIANILKPEFDSVIWVDADLPPNKNFNFSSIKIAKVDKQVNLGEFIKEHKILVLVDNLNKDVKKVVEEFNNLSSKSSKLLLTSYQRTISEKSAIKISYMDKDISVKILNNINNKPNSHQLEKIIKKVKGFPLVLNLIRNFVEMGDFDWEDIVTELDNIHIVSDTESGHKLCHRILGMYLKEYEKEFALINYIKNTTIHKNFLEFILGAFRLKNLSKIAILGEKEDFYIIHQLIYSSISELVHSVNYEAEFDQKLYNYLYETNKIKNLMYFKFLYNHNDFLDRVYNKTKNTLLKNVIYYALIIASDYFAEKEQILSEVQSLDLKEKSYYNVAIIIEKYEIELFKIKDDDEVKYNEKILESIEKLTGILDCSVDEDIQKLLYHHIGKLYLWINDFEKAEENFKTVLLIDNNYYSTRLQLARMYMLKEEYEDGKKHIRYTLNNSYKDEIQLTILFSFYELLTKDCYKELKKVYINTNVDEFVELILKSLNSKFDFPYRLLEKFARDLAYNNFDYFSEICDNLPIPDKINSNNALKIAYAQIQSSYYMNLKYHDIQNRDKKRQMALSLAKKYFLSAELKNDFNRKQLIDLHLADKEFKKAKDVYEKIKDKENVFYLQSKCKIEKGLNEHPEAIKAIDKAIEIVLKKGAKTKYLGAFYHDKAEAQYYLNDKECLNTLELAISKQDNQKTKRNWRNKLEEWNQSFK